MLNTLIGRDMLFRRNTLIRRNTGKFILLVLLAASAGFARQGAAPASSSAASAANQPSKAKVLSREEFDNLLAPPGKVLLLDVRKPTEIAANGGFEVYLNIQAADLAKHLAEIPRDRPIITVSNHANRAGQAADLLTGKGFNVVGAIGAQVYEEAGGKLVKFAPLPPAAPAGASVQK